MAKNATKSVSKTHGAAAHPATNAATNAATAPATAAQAVHQSPTLAPAPAPLGTKTTAPMPRNANDPFAAYNGVDGSALGLLARDSFEQAGTQTRIGSQACIASILALYANEKLAADSSPLALIKSDGKFNTKTAKALAKLVFGLGAKDKVERQFEKTIRDNATLVIACINRRIVLLWNAEAKCLNVPRWTIARDESMKTALAKDFDATTKLIPSLVEMVQLDGKEGRTLVTMRENLAPKPEAKRQQAQKKTASETFNLKECLDGVVNHIGKLRPEDKLSDEILDNVALIMAEVEARNGAAEFVKHAKALAGK